MENQQWIDPIEDRKQELFFVSVEKKNAQLFYSGQSYDGSQTMQEVVSELNAKFYAKIEDIENSVSHDIRKSRKNLCQECVLSIGCNQQMVKSPNKRGIEINLCEIYAPVKLLFVLCRPRNMRSCQGEDKAFGFCDRMRYNTLYYGVIHEKMRGCHD